MGSTEANECVDIRLYRGCDLGHVPFEALSQAAGQGSLIF